MNENQKMENQGTENEVVEVKESKFKKMTSKVGGTVKKHGKKVAVAFGALGLAGLGYLVGSKLKKHDSDEDYDYDEDIDDEELMELIEMETEEESEEQ